METVRARDEFSRKAPGEDGVERWPARERLLFLIIATMASWRIVLLVGQGVAALLR